MTNKQKYPLGYHKIEKVYYRIEYKMFSIIDKSKNFISKNYENSVYKLLFVFLIGLMQFRNVSADPDDNLFRGCFSGPYYGSSWMFFGWMYSILFFILLILIIIFLIKQIQIKNKEVEK